MNGSKDSLHGVDLDAALDRAERDAAGRRLRAAGAALRPDPAFARQLEDRLRGPDASDPAAAPLATAGPRPPPPRRRRDRAARRPRTGRRRRAVLMPLLDQVFARNAHPAGRRPAIGPRPQPLPDG